MADRKLFDDDFLRRLQRLGVLAKRLSAGAGAPGQRRSHRLGDGLEFADHRAYAPGDDIRFLDWPYYARMERLLLRLFHEHSEGAVTILLDASGSMSLGQTCKFDYARRTAAALAYVAMASLDRVHIVPFSDTPHEGLRTGRSRGQILQVLTFLEELTAGGRTGLARTIEAHARSNDSTGTVMLLTDGIDLTDELSAALALLNRHRDEVFFLHLVDRLDAEPSVLGPAQLSPIETSGRLSLNVTEVVLSSYRQRWREFVRGVEKTCLSRGAIYVQAPTRAPFERLVLRALQRAGVLGG